MSAAVARGTHRLWDEPPWIFDDPFALILVGPGWEDIAAASRALARPAVARQGHAGVLVRSRYPEERLLDGDYSQYVVLGAGLDSFAWRRPDLCGTLRVFEVERGEPTGTFDTLMAAHALSLRLTFVTNNTPHFARIVGLATENWL